MKEIEIKITEKDKMGKRLTLFNFKDELFNFMYKKTVAESSRTSMRFFILIFFLSLKIGSDSLLMNLLDNNIEKIKKLNKDFSKKGKLRRGEYSELVKNNDLGEVFKNDIFFILITTILDSDRIFIKFNKYFSENIELKNEFQRIIEKYKNELYEFDADFKINFISDDRFDDFGEYHDLSKSVYRTIKMRTSRCLDLELHKYAELKIVKSESPIILHIIQHIDYQIIINLWNAYKLGDYVKDVWKFVNDNALICAFTGQVLADKFLKWDFINGRENRKEKLKAKAEFEIAKNNQEQNKKLLQLIEVLADSVIESSDYLKKEIDDLKDKREKASRGIISTNKNKKIREIEKKITKLENIEVGTLEK